MLLAAILCPTPVFAWDETLNLIPAITARETYDSSVNLNGKGDMEHRLVPSLKLDVKKERLRGHLGATALGYKYTRLTDYDRIDQKYDAVFEADATERLKLNLNSGLTVDHTFSASLSETGQQAQSVIRRLYTFQPSATYQVTERNSATLFGGYSQTAYGSKQYTDSNSRVLGGLWGYQFTERFQGLAQVSATHTAMTDAYQNVISTMTGGEYALSEQLKARVLMGVNSLKSRNPAGQDSSARGFSTDSSLSWKGETHSLTVLGNRDMTTGLNGENIVRTRLGFNASKDMTERLKLLLSSSLTSSKSTGEGVQTRTTTWMEVSPSVQYRTTEYSTLALGYGYGAQTVKETDQTKCHSQVFLNFSISFP